MGPTASLDAAEKIEMCLSSQWHVRYTHHTFPLPFTYVGVEYIHQSLEVF